MMYVLLLMLAGILISAYEVPGMVRKKQWGEMAAFFVFLVAGLTLGTLMILDVKVPNPTKLIDAIFEPLAPKEK